MTRVFAVTVFRLYFSCGRDVGDRSPARRVALEARDRPAGPLVGDGLIMWKFPRVSRIEVLPRHADASAAGPAHGTLVAGRRVSHEIVRRDIFFHARAKSTVHPDTARPYAPGTLTSSLFLNPAYAVTLTLTLISPGATATKFRRRDASAATSIQRRAMV